MKKDVREELLNSAFEEIYTQGYNGTGLSKILNRAGVQKGAMYHYFSSKKDLALAVISEKVCSRSRERYEVLENARENTLDLLITILNERSENDFKNGCPIGNLILELSSEDRDFAQALEECLDVVQGIYERAIIKAINNKEIKEEDPKDLAQFMLSILEGGLLLSKNSGSSKEYFSCVKRLEEYVNFLKLK